MGGAGKLHLEIGKAVAAEAAAETRHRRWRDFRAFGKLDDRGIHRKFEIVHDDIGDTGLGGGEPALVFLQCAKYIQAGPPADPSVNSSSCRQRNRSRPCNPPSWTI